MLCYKQRLRLWQVATNRELTDGYLAITSRLVNNAGILAANSFRNLGSWRDSDVQRYINGLMPALDGIKRQSASLTTSYYREIARNQDRDFTVPSVAATALTTEALRRGVGAEIVYQRPFVDLWTAIKKGAQLKDAIEAGAIRARSLASTEVQLAKRNVGLFSRDANRNIVGYIRTLTGTENCALCFVASTQRYTRGELMPIHPGCDCGELPLYGNQDPGQVIDEERLTAVHEAVEARFGFSDASGREIDYRAITIHEHGELGPILTVKGQHFTGPNDL
jgi:hypothetical protein